MILKNQLKNQSKNKLNKMIICAVLLISILTSFGTNMTVYANELPSGISYDEIGKRIEGYVEEHLETTAAMAVDIFDENGDIYSNYFGYADKENEVYADKDTVFEWGSATKLLVWVSVMQLYEQGKLELDKDIKEYLPEDFLTNLKYDTPVTIINLMNHTAGFQEVYSDLFVKDEKDILPLGEALYANEPEQIYEPGTVTAYSNWGVALAGYIVECVSGVEFSEYVHQNIFEPLGMKHSAIAADLSDNEWVKEKREKLQCYTTEGELIKDCFYYITLYPAGMCTSTLEDFSKFAKSLLKDSGELFTPTNYYGDSDVPLNCHGFWVLPFENLTYGHGGNTAGCSSYLLIDLEKKLGAVVMTNQSGESIYNKKMMDMIFGEFDADKYFGGRVIPDGIYTSARTARKGHMKFMSLSFSTIDENENKPWVHVNDKMDKVCYAYEDYLKVPYITFITEMGLFILWVAAIAFSVISIVVKLFKKVVLKLRHKERGNTFLGKWSTFAAITQLMLVGLFAEYVSKISAYEVSRNYQWIFIAFGVAAVVMIIMLIYGIYAIIKGKREAQKGYKSVYDILTVVFLLVSVVNIFYWELV